jgi:nucleoside-diphosphate-sugar epimerase
MLIVVTGATGFFGAGITDALRRGGHDVIAVARNIDPAGPGAERLDVTDADRCRAVIRPGRGIDAVVHAAAIAHVPEGALHAAECFRVNAEGTRHVADAAADAGVTRFVMISSVAVYGDYDLPPRVHEGAPLRPTGVYGSAKRDAEGFVTAPHRPWGAVVLRMASMYSERFLLNIRKRVEPPVIGRACRVMIGGDARRYSFCALANAVEVVQSGVEGRLAAGTYNVADRYDYSQREIVSALDRLEGPRPALPLPAGLAMAARPLIAATRGDLRRRLHSYYWKYCEPTLYATDALFEQGVSGKAALLSLGLR